MCLKGMGVCMWERGSDLYDMYKVNVWKSRVRMFSKCIPIPACAFRLLVLVPLLLCVLLLLMGLLVRMYICTYVRT